MFYSLPFTSFCLECICVLLATVLGGLVPRHHRRRRGVNAAGFASCTEAYRRDARQSVRVLHTGNCHVSVPYPPIHPLRFAIIFPHPPRPAAAGASGRTMRKGEGPSGPPSHPHLLNLAPQTPRARRQARFVLAETAHPPMMMPLRARHAR